MPDILWWGRADLDYSRNRICRDLLQHLGFRLIDFHPRVSALADIEAQYKNLKADLVWVPCFRHRDLPAALRWAKKRQLPLVFDPLISAWQKKVFERKKWQAHGLAARSLLRRESKYLQKADLVLLDTEPQRTMFVQCYQLSPEKTACVYVGAEESLFQPQACAPFNPNRVEVLFYGSFIALHGVETIIAAAKLTAQYVHIHWVLLGEGPVKAQAQLQAAALHNVRFEACMAYEALPQRIAQADIVLGVFADSEKASQVIPNKVFQALACARPVITRESPAYPPMLGDEERTALWQIAPNDPQQLAQAVLRMANQADALRQPAHALFQAHFSQRHLQQQLAAGLATLGFSAT